MLGTRGSIKYIVRKKGEAVLVICTELVLVAFSIQDCIRLSIPTIVTTMYDGVSFTSGGFERFPSCEFLVSGTSWIRSLLLSSRGPLGESQWLLSASRFGGPSGHTWLDRTEIALTSAISHSGNTRPSHVPQTLFLSAQLPSIQMFFSLLFRISRRASPHPTTFSD